MRLKVKFEKGILKPLENVDLEEGKIYDIVIREKRFGRISKYFGILKHSETEERYYEYISERTSFC